jgi:hypothetical protein
MIFGEAEKSIVSTSSFNERTLTSKVLCVVIRRYRPQRQKAHLQCLTFAGKWVSSI